MQERTTRLSDVHRSAQPLRPPAAPFSEARQRAISREPQYLAFVTTLVFTATDHNSITWAAANIKLSNGYIGAIDSGSLDFTGTRYIYYTVGDNTINNSATYSDAIGYKKVLVAIAVEVASGGYAKIFVMSGTTSIPETYIPNAVWKDASEGALSLADQTSSVGWTDLDLTAYTSSTAIWAYIRLHMSLDSIDGVALAILGVRKNGTTPDYYPWITLRSTDGDIAGARAIAEAWIGLDAGQVIEYFLSITGTIQVDLDISVLGYMEPSTLDIVQLSDDIVKDSHIDWGGGSGQVDADDVPESATKKWAGATGADLVNPMTTAEDLIVGGVDGAEDRLAKGNNDEILTMVGGAVAWTAAAGGGKPVPTIVVAASDAISTTGADYICSGAADEVDINAAIGDLGATGGVVYLTEGTFIIEDPILMTSNVALIGSGFGTILKVPDSHDAALKIISNSGAKTNVLLRGFAIDGNKANQASGNMYGVYFDGVDDSLIDNIYVKNIHGKDGMYIANADRFNVINCYITGAEMFGASFTSSNYVAISNNFVWSNANAGLYLNTCLDSALAGNILQGNLYGAFFANSQRCSMSRNVVRSNTSYGIYIYQFGGTCKHIVMSTNIITGNGDAGIYNYDSDYCLMSGNLIEGNATNGGILILLGQHNIIADNIILNNTTDNIKLLNANNNHVTGNFVRRGAAEPADGIHVSGNDNYVEGNDLLTAGHTNNLNDGGTRTIMRDNRGATVVQEVVMFEMKNTDGDALAAGDVVVLKAVAAGNEVTHTAAHGDDKVFGMAMESIANNVVGKIQTQGKTTALKVHGTDDIAIGNYLSTFAGVGIARKAAAGDMAFAIALEAYTNNDSNGVIDALLITPRKVGVVV